MSIDTIMKNRLRRGIRVAMILMGIFLLLVALCIPLANNAIALGVEKTLKALPLPPDTRLVESISAAGRFTEGDGQMQYFGAVLLESDCSQQELQQHYAAYSSGALESCIVVPQTEAAIARVPSLSFRASVTGERYYIVYTMDRSSHPFQGWLDLDAR